MDILPDEIDEVVVVGQLFDDDVKMIKTTGGFNVFIGKKSKYAKKAEALAGASHPALGVHQISKDYGSDFMPSLAKTEHEQMPEILNKTEYLPHQSITDGLELYTLKKNNDVEFILYKHGLTLTHYKSTIKNNTLILNKPYINKTLLKSNKDIANALSRAIRDEAHEFNVTHIKKS